MNPVDMVSYLPLIDALKDPLPDTIENVQQLRQMVAFAESYGVIVAEHRRKLLKELEKQTAIELDRLRNASKNEAAEKYSKLNADEKKIMLAAAVTDISAELDFVTNLEKLIARRCSLGQSISNSFNTETQSSFNK